ncbi:glycosyl transferase [Luteitalea sp. TBR-22]|uniref:glycosyltransferase family 2 protein n=1 Tax=Luteitalea sp. TBR-22 TaxID=2802971 RepID=UPI001AF666D6|nr:glycosyltransferase family 2 protein [Luteitalea sp. TBR-22]BCS34734.1 glycosyl transferase [Luteitalea sp. TBR-22]
MRPPVSVGVVTYHPDALLARCVASVRAQAYDGALTLHVWDNASTPASRALIEPLTSPDEHTFSEANLGFSGGHNALIRRSTAAYYLCLNPDAVLSPGYVAELVATLESNPTVGSATGRLLRLDDDAVLDSTGIVMTPDQRHLDRGADEPAAGHYLGGPEPIFGPSGAVAMYRREMLEDVAWRGEYFDEAFFAYREDADLAWRAQWRGWGSLYVPAAVAWHRRRVTPGRRSMLPAAINRYSVRNRFLLRLKNQSAGLAWRFALPGLWRDAQVVGYVLLREWTSLPGLLDVVRLLPTMLVRRRHVLGRRRVRSAELARWFEKGRPGQSGVTKVTDTPG